MLTGTMGWSSKLGLEMHSYGSGKRNFRIRRVNSRLVETVCKASSLREMLHVRHGEEVRVPSFSSFFFLFFFLFPTFPLSPQISVNKYSVPRRKIVHESEPSSFQSSTRAKSLPRQLAAVSVPSLSSVHDSLFVAVRSVCPPRHLLLRSNRALGKERDRCL